MKDTTETPSYRSYRRPRAVIAFAAWAYHRFPLSPRETEELLAARDRGDLPDHPDLDPGFRAGLCPRAAVPAAGAWRQVASGRDGDPDER